MFVTICVFNHYGIVVLCYRKQIEHTTYLLHYKKKTILIISNYTLNVQFKFLVLFNLDRCTVWYIRK